VLKFGNFCQLSRPVRAPWPHQGVYHLAPFVNNCKEHVMLQANEIQQRFTQIQQTIQQAEQACRSGDAPEDLKNCIEQMARESQQASQVMQSQDQQRMVECVDNLESMGDEAKRLSRSAAQMSPQLESAVTKVHSELSNLKHQLH
jgi:acyl carrier protein phosphodiesterase